MNSLSTDQFFDLENFEHRSLFEGVEYPWEVLPKVRGYLQEQTLGKIDAEVPDGAWLVNPELISIGEGTLVEPGAYIKGPCVIGKGCQVRHGAYIRGNCLAGDGCVIGHATEVKNAVFLNGAQAGHFAYVGDSILGNKCNLGAGTKLANLKLDGKEVQVFFQGEKLKTGLRKFGALVGDGAQLGCNCVTNPGTLIGKNAALLPCVNRGGLIVPKG